MDKIKSIVKKVMVNIKEHGIIHTGKKSYQAVKRRLSAKHNPKNTYHNSNYQANESFSEYNTDIKPICFYLPQFHTFKENDEWWGKGFMEWTNTKKAYPRYLHHYQPREPHNDIGYYTLDNAETIRKQVALAKEHGIYGFCFYYYWFSGKRLMEKPLDIFLQNKDIDMNFCICWANENWTRTWDGAEHNILIKQDYSEKDKVEFVKDCLKYIQDDRYIKVNGKPVILVYNPEQIEDRNNVFNSWREEFRKAGVGEVLIWICQIRGGTSYTLKLEDIVDGEVEFPPHMSRIKEICLTPFKFKKEVMPRYFFDYSEASKGYANKTYKTKLPVYKTIALDWDNSARKKDNWVHYINYSLKGFYEWTKGVRKYTNKAQLDDKIFFINAWNEWAEGTYLEPDKLTGYANINTFSKALYDIPLNNKILNIKSQTNNLLKDAKVTLLFYISNNDDIKYIPKFLDKIMFKYDVKILTYSDISENYMKDISKGLIKESVDLEIIKVSGNIFDKTNMHILENIKDKYAIFIDLLSFNGNLDDGISELAASYNKSINYILSGNRNIKFISFGMASFVKNISEKERNKIIKILLDNNINVMIPHNEIDYIDINNIIINKDVIDIIKKYNIKDSKYLGYILPVILEYNNIHYKNVDIS